MDLSQNKIQGVSEIRDGLSCNVALEQLDLSHNIINDSGLANLSSALASNGCLETLSISFNSYTLVGLREFLSIFAENESLRNVSFSMPDNIKDHEVFALQDLLLTTLKTLK